MLYSFNLFCVLCLEVSHTEPELVKLLRIVDIPDWGEIRKEEHHTLELGCDMELLLGDEFVLKEVEDEGCQVDDEWVPHEGEGQYCPQDMAGSVEVV